MQPEKPTIPEAENNAGTEPRPAPPRNAITRLYDKIPLTLRQVDILVKVLCAAIVVLLIYGILKGSA